MEPTLSRPAGVRVGNAELGAGDGLFMILGPCVIESEELTLAIAREVARVSASSGLPTIFKASFDKANRTSIDSYRGPGLEKGLEILKRVRDETGLPVLSDIHSEVQAAAAAEVLDVLQIPAFLCRQTDVLLAAGRTGKAINLKKGQFQAPEDMEHALRKIAATGNRNVLITERGASFGYGDLVADMRSIVRMIKLGFPVVFDATHSAQYPGRGGACSGGDRTLVPHLARAAVAAGADGIFMEVHPDPDRALCDGPNSLNLADLEPLVSNLAAIYNLVPHCVRKGREVRPVENRPPERMSTTLEERLRNIRLVILDVDGALTDGGIIFGSDGLEIKSFDVRDGHGIKIAKRMGLEVVIVTGRISDVATRRAEDLGITRVYQRVWDKKVVLEQLLAELPISADQIAALGDDVVDIPLFRRVGVGFTVPEAPEEVKREASVVTAHAGGHGAAREMIETILKAQEKWESAISRYYE